MKSDRSPWNRRLALTALAIVALAVSVKYIPRPGGEVTHFSGSASSNTAAQGATSVDDQSRSNVGEEINAALARLETDTAEDAFSRGDTATALAYLARTTRRDPDNNVAARRLLFALTHRSFAFPAQPPLQHEGVASCARFSPDGARIVTATDDGAVRVWRADNSTLLREPIQLGSPVLWADFDSTGDRIVAGARDGSGWLIEVEGSAEPRRLLLSQKPVFHVEFSSTGTRALTASRDNTIAIWNAETGEPEAKLTRHEGALKFARFSPDGKRILSGDSNGVAFLWDAETGEVEIGPMTFPGSIDEGRFSPDGASLALGLSDGTARLLETLTGLLLCAPIQHATPVATLAYSPDGLTLATATLGDGQIQLFDAEDGSLISGPVTTRGTVGRLLFSPDGLRLASASASGAIEVWDGLKLLPVKEALLVNGAVGNMQFSPDGARLLQTASQSPAQVWDVRLSGALPREFSHESNIEAVAFDSSGDRLATATSEGEVRLWEFSTDREIWTKRPHKKRIVSLHFSADNQRLITVSKSGSIADMDTETGELKEPLLSLDTPTTRAYFGPKGQRFAALSPNGSIKIWQAESGELKPVLPENNDITILHARFSSDGMELAVATEKQVQLWNLSKGAEIVLFMDFPQRINAIEYAGGRSRIVVGLNDGSVRIHDSATGKQIGSAMRHSEAVWRIRVSRDGRLAATSSDDRTVRIWDTATALLVSEPLTHQSLPWAFDFNADGSLLFTGTVGGRLRAWDVASGHALSASLSHGEPVEFVRFNPKNNVVTAGGTSPILNAWRIPDVDATTPGWFPDLAEAIGGRRLNKRHLLEPAPPQILAALHTELQSQATKEVDAFTILHNWLFQDSLTRAARPAADHSAREEISKWLTRDDLPMLRQFALRDPSNPKVWQKIAKLLSSAAPEADPSTQIANARIAAFCRQRAEQLGGRKAPVAEADAPTSNSSSENAPSPTAEAQPRPSASPPVPDSSAALYFDGRTSRISASNIPFDEYDAFTIEAWVQQWRSHLLSQGVLDSEENALWLTLGDAGSENPRWTCGWRSGAGKNWDHPIAADHPSAWQHLALTFDGRQLSIYLNGKLRHSTEAPRPGPLLKNRTLMIGAHEWTDRLTFGTGFLHNLRVSRTLRYQGDFVPNPILKADRRTVLLYDFSIDPELRAVDRSGNKRHGTIRGAIWSEGQ